MSSQPSAAPGKGAVPPPAVLNALKALTALNQLVIEAGNLGTPAELYFHIVNKTAIFSRYQRAVLFTLPEGGVAAISGVSRFDKNSTLHAELRTLFRKLDDTSKPAILSSDDIEDDSAAWHEYIAKCGGMSILWLPLTCRGKELAGLWLERWGQPKWNVDEIGALHTLAKGYAISFDKLQSRRTSLVAQLGAKKMALAIAVALAALSIVPVRQRIVSPCEVVAKKPYAVTAEVDGVIRNVLIAPGQDVEVGQVLALYEKDSAEEERKAAEQQVRISEADYQRVRVESLYNSEMKGGLQILANRLEQDKNRYAIVATRVKKMTVVSPASGVAIMRDPYELEGKPVAIGERLLVVADPNKSKLRISLPVADRIDFLSDAEVKVFLHSDLQGSRRAILSYVAQISTLNEVGMSEFIAEAEWSDESDGVQIGMKGNAVIYGSKTFLASWLLRRPIAAVRRFFGV